MALKAYLQRIAPLSERDWEAAAPLFVREAIKKGDYYLREGQYCNKVSFIESGLFKLFYLVDGEEKIMLFFSEHQFMTDYFGFLTCTPSIRPVQALEDSVVLSISREDLQKLYDASQGWERMGRLLAERAYVLAVQRANRLLHDDYETRFDTFLNEHPSLLNRVPQYMIASYLDMTPETLSRVKRRLMEKGGGGRSVHEGIDPKLV